MGVFKLFLFVIVHELHCTLPQNNVEDILKQKMVANMKERLVVSSQ